MSIPACKAAADSACEPLRTLDSLFVYGTKLGAPVKYAKIARARVVGLQGQKYRIALPIPVGQTWFVYATTTNVIGESNPSKNVGTYLTADVGGTMARAFSISKAGVGSSAVKYQLVATADMNADATLDLFDVAGRKMAPTHRVHVAGRERTFYITAEREAAGLYFARLAVPSMRVVEVARLVVVR